MSDVDIVQETRDAESFALVIAAINDELHTAADEPCNEKGHSALCRGTTGIARAVALTFKRVEKVPRETVGLLRAEVVSLVQSHADDSVKRALSSRLPDAALAGVPATPGWHEIARRFAATLAASPWAIVGIVGLFAVSPSLRELAKALVEAMR